MEKKILQKVVGFVLAVAVIGRFMMPQVTFAAAMEPDSLNAHTCKIVRETASVSKDIVYEHAYVVKDEILEDGSVLVTYDICTVYKVTRTYNQRCSLCGIYLAEQIVEAALEHSKDCGVDN